MKCAGLERIKQRSLNYNKGRVSMTLELEILEKAVNKVPAMYYDLLDEVNKRGIKYE